MEERHMLQNQRDRLLSRQTNKEGFRFRVVILALTCLCFGMFSTANAGIAIDANLSKDGASAGAAITSSTFSTHSGNELLLAFVATDYLSGANTTVNSVSGAGLTWVLVVRTNKQSGSSEIWRAFAQTALSNVSVTANLSQAVISSLTIVSFSGVDSSGVAGAGAIGTTTAASAASGAPTAKLSTTRNNSWVFGVGNDYDQAIARTPGSGQTLVHQYLTPAGDTYWVQMQATSTPLSGTAVTINDTAPTSDRYNLSIVEVLPAPAGTFAISGTISPSSIGSGATLSLTGLANSTTTADSNGNYSFPGLTNGSYTVTPAKSGFVFTPASQPVTVSGGNVTAVNFSGQAAPTWTISGTISPIAGGAGAQVALGGTATKTTTADASGNYSFTGLTNGSYTVTPSNSGFTIAPTSASVTFNNANQTGINFTAQPITATWSISGTISPAAGGGGATVSLTGAATATVTADSNGNYSFSQLLNGSYVVTPSKNGYTYKPASQSVALSGSNVTGVNFTAVAPTTSLTVDANVSTDGTTSSASIASRVFSTTTGNELLLAFIATDYLGGANTTVTKVTGAGLTWTLVVRTNAQSGTSEIWRTFAPSALTNVSVTGSLSQSVVSSITVMSFTGVDPTGVGGAGAVGAVASANAGTGAPTAALTTTRNYSWVLGVGNDYDQALPRTPGTGQTLVHQFLTSAGDTYWVQMQASTTPVSGTRVTINDTSPTSDRYNLSIVEVLPSSGGIVDTTPPTVSMTSPAQGAAVANLLTVSATASDDTSVAGVQFLLDGNSLGAEVMSPPYSMTWDTTSAAAGSHTLSARARDSVGLTTTSSSVTITVDNSGNPAVVGSWSPVVSLPAVAVNLILLSNGKVLFYQDGATATVWDYTNNQFTSVPVSVDLFCSGHALLRDGRVLVVGGYGGGGGSIGIANAEIFDPATNSWTAVPHMAYKRWYPNATTLPDGRVLVTAGWQTTSHTNAGISEIYDSTTNSWTQLTNANNPFETYPFLYVLPDGRVIHIGGSEYATDTDVLNIATTSWSVIDSSIVDGASATMFTPGVFMKAGSATDSQGVGPASNTTFVLDTTQPSPVWRQTPSMAYPRSFLNLTMLPNGGVLATGGETDKNGGDIANAVYNAELWSPQSLTWTTMAAMHTPREYHGTALLLPDGRVLVSGMGADFGQVPDQQSAEFFSPPYLFNGPRPVISQAPSQLQYNSTFSITTPDAASIAKVVLIRTGAVTHFFDQNERYVPLSFQQGSGVLNVTAPVNSSLAPPGYYMLFIVNSKGVPSMAAMVVFP
jgi:hypothetical protein